jgi:hypothetical protein
MTRVQLFSLPNGKVDGVVLRRGLDKDGHDGRIPAKVASAAAAEIKHIIKFVTFYFQVT